jgi:hypothetical protein
MSRTPETIRNKKAEKTRDTLYGTGVVSGLLAWGAFSNGADGLGLLLGLGAAGLVYVGSKIKTKYQKRGEVGVYR